MRIVEPPRRSWSRIFGPNVNMLRMPIPIAATDKTLVIEILLMKSKFAFSRTRRMFSFLSQPRRSEMSNISREQKIAVYIDIKIPKIRVTANPLICSVPIAYRANAVNSVVMFASRIVTVALSKPFRIAILSAAPRSSSSRIRSKISTLASTDIPTVNTRPARPVRVSGCWMNMISAKISAKFKIKLMVAITPANR